MTFPGLPAPLAHDGWAVLQIVFFNVLLGGDNAIAIAMACRSLAPRQRRIGIMLGTVLGIVLRLLLIGVIGAVLAVPYMHVIAAALLVWIGVQMLRHQDDEETTHAASALWRAVLTIVCADFAMSLDNALATAAIAQTLPEASRLFYVFVGLAVGAPVIAFGSNAMIVLLQRVPALTYVGAALLGWVAGDMVQADRHVDNALQQIGGGTAVAQFGIDAGFLVSVAVAVLVPLLGHLLMRRQAQQG
ncbi:integral membrane protein, YjbE family [Burkholderia sp. Ch1-1]|uniref:Integral membrane protein, YjbE family n=1 Tax=Paraburkholderia dioscoreae TaxID=2604047 RepID=A0A5Q4ZKU4_9BURK|nr:YjbE family putative metal transport protein [Paraburkholderia dioscoreae]EIF33564.1 integral membrane protein, YjbE family [Burkholderia sp. Ch1-1]VVD32427.1 Integral membrane protein, YjbE family [Paraburkholderia dioscoreae]